MRLLGIDKETLVRYKNKRSWLYNIKSIGFRYHMSNINAAIGLAQMKKMEKTISRKKHMVNEYDKAFANMKEIDIVNKNYDEIAPFNYIIKVKKNRNRLIDFLKEKGIDTGIHYIPNHIQSFFRKFRVKLPVTEKLYKEILTLPLYYGMSDKDVLHVINSVKEFFKK
jgi:perosamine synthetase